MGAPALKQRSSSIDDEMHNGVRLGTGADRLQCWLEAVNPFTTSTLSNVAQRWPAGCDTSHLSLEGLYIVITALFYSCRTVVTSVSLHLWASGPWCNYARKNYARVLNVVCVGTRPLVGSKPRGDQTDDEGHQQHRQRPVDPLEVTSHEVVTPLQWNDPRRGGILSRAAHRVTVGAAAIGS